MEFYYEIHTIALHRPLKPINNNGFNWHSCLKKKKLYITESLLRSILFPSTTNGNVSGWFGFVCSKKSLCHKFKFSNVFTEVTSNTSIQASASFENDKAIDRKHSFPVNYLNLDLSKWITSYSSIHTSRIPDL